MIASLPLSEWPAADRIGWGRACEPGLKGRRGGPASHLKTTSRQDLERRYGYFLTSLQERGALDVGAAAAQLVTCENVEAYIERCHAGWTSVTLAGSVSKLQRMACLLAPAMDIRWLREIADDLTRVAYPKARFDRIFSTEVLVSAGLTLVGEAQSARRRQPIWRAGQIRDGLMVAMLAYHPLRRKNFADLKFGRNFIREGDRWVINLPGSETKNGKPDLRLVRPRLNAAIALYLTWARPLLMREVGEWMLGAPCLPPHLTGPLWVGQYGEAMTYSSFEKRIVETTRTTIGTALSPHDFRRSGAYTARSLAGSKPHLASGLLQHVDGRVVDENYNLASSLQAAEAFGEWIDGIAGSRGTLA